MGGLRAKKFVRLILTNLHRKHRRRVIEAKEAIAYPVFGHAVEL